MKKHSPQTWNSKREQSCQLLRQKLAVDPVLVWHDPYLEIQVHTEASEWSFCGVLLHKQKDGSCKPVAGMNKQTT